jgi:uncharacterized membrane protein YkoI
MKTQVATGIGISTLLLPCIIMAQAVTQSPSTHYAAADVAAFHGSQSTLTNAIEAVQQSTGGTVVEIRFAQSGATPGFHTVVAKNGGVEFAHIDQGSKSVVPVDTRPDWMLKWQQKTAVQLAKSATVSLSQAIRTAEASKNAPAIAAGIARSASNPDSAVHAYNVLIDANGSLTRIAVDSSTGQIISDPSVLQGWP